jgi:FtsH-binding integral membrane protein
MEAYTQRLSAVAFAQEEERAAFIRRTYMHLAGAVALFVLLEYVFINFTPLPMIMLNFIGGNRYGWLMILGAFVLLGWLGRSMASKADSTGAQYAGLAVYVVGEAIIFVPILFIAAYLMEAPDLLRQAALLTGLMFCGLTAVVFTTRKDFSFLRGALTIGGFVALGLIVGGTFFGFSLGLWFSVGMVILASGAILYDTSKILHHYSTDQHVAAALELFASVALLFWYILRILMSRRR